VTRVVLVQLGVPHEHVRGGQHERHRAHEHHERVPRVPHRAPARASAPHLLHHAQRPQRAHVEQQVHERDVREARGDAPPQLAFPDRLPVRHAHVLVPETPRVEVPPHRAAHAAHDRRRGTLPRVQQQRSPHRSAGRDGWMDSRTVNDLPRVQERRSPHRSAGRSADDAGGSRPPRREDERTCEKKATRLFFFTVFVPLARSKTTF
jgi:hypothetical protein